MFNIVTNSHFFVLTISRQRSFPKAMKTGPYSEELLEALDTSKGTLLHICMMYTDCRKEHVTELYHEMVYQLVKGYPRFRGESGVTTWAYRTALDTATEVTPQ